jgi:glycerophosphoryl diester phosphodiesterase
VWTVNREVEMKKLASWGVDGIITNYPDRAKSSLARP